MAELTTESTAFPINLIHVHQPGFLTTIQDFGRRGWQQQGFTEAGAMDLAALISGNRLVGNALDAAGLELTLIGPELVFQGSTVIAITGADLGARLNDIDLPLDVSVKVASGDRLTFIGGAIGCRAYVCVAGGIAVPLVHGSRATDLIAGIGGYRGRSLRRGDIIPVRAIENQADLTRRAGRRLKVAGSSNLSPPSTAAAVQVVLGPHADAFTPDSLDTFLGSRYTVAPQSNRVGLRLQGPSLVYQGVERLSEGQPLGAIQVPHDGQPIALMADRATVGGYPKIAIATTPAHSVLAQARPGSTLRFEAVSHAQATRAYRQWWQALTTEI